MLDVSGWSVATSAANQGNLTVLKYLADKDHDYILFDFANIVERSIVSSNDSLIFIANKLKYKLDDMIEIAININADKLIISELKSMLDAEKSQELG